jgi:hypothetical protein
VSADGICEDRCRLERPSPNPVRDGQATIRFHLPRALPIELGLYDVEGRKLATLAGGIRRGGDHVATIAGLPSGVYFCRLATPEFTASRKLIAE